MSLESCATFAKAWIIRTSSACESAGALNSILTADFGRITDKMVIMSETMGRMESHFADVSGKLANIERSMSVMSDSVFVLRKSAARWVE